MADPLSDRSDWTVDPETGRSNSSPEFLRLKAEIADLIRHNGGTALSHLWAHSTAGLILAQLAHVHDVGPLATDDTGLDREETS